MKLLTSLTLFFGLVVYGQMPDVPADIDHSAFDSLLQRYVNDQGLVDYKLWQETPEDVQMLKDYLAQFEPLPETPAEGDDLIASLLNAYNAFTIEYILENYPTESIRLLDQPFDGKRNEVGGQKISVDDIEHKMLRPLIGWKVHALVVCAARSCPPLHNRAFFAATWEETMKERYHVWLAREDLNSFHPDRGRNGEVELSQIFRWYAEDYTDENRIQDILERFGPEKDQKLFSTRAYRIRYLSYHWGLNDQGDTGATYRHSFLRSLF